MEVRTFIFYFINYLQTPLTLAVKIGEQECTSPTIVDAWTITCVLNSGTGEELPVSAILKTATSVRLVYPTGTLIDSRWSKPVFLPPPTKFREGNVFSRVCLSVHRRRGPHVTITHHVLDLTVQPPPPTWDLTVQGTPTPC